MILLQFLPASSLLSLKLDEKATHLRRLEVGDHKCDERTMTSSILASRDYGLRNHGILEKNGLNLAGFDADPPAARFC